MGGDGGVDGDVVGSDLFVAAVFVGRVQGDGVEAGGGVGVLRILGGGGVAVPEGPEP